VEKQAHNLIEVIEWCRAKGLTQADVVGRWVWILFDEKPPAELRQELKDFGFRWVKKRGQWAHNCGHPSRHGKVSPRAKYGSVPVSQFDDQLAVA
jgi:hypothetical protein